MNRQRVSVSSHVITSIVAAHDHTVAAHESLVAAHGG
jgi:hypothetical protein